MTREQDQAPNYVFLEFGLLLMVTGFFAVVLVTGLVFIFTKESTIASSSSLTTVTVAAVSGLSAFVIFLSRRLRRLIVSR